MVVTGKRRGNQPLRGAQNARVGHRFGTSERVVPQMIGPETAAFEGTITLPKSTFTRLCPWKRWTESWTGDGTVFASDQKHQCERGRDDGPDNDAGGHRRSLRVSGPQEQAVNPSRNGGPGRAERATRHTS